MRKQARQNVFKSDTKLGDLETEVPSKSQGRTEAPARSLGVQPTRS